VQACEYVDDLVEQARAAAVSLMDPASPGAMQQEILDAKPGYYVQACLMDTQPTNRASYESAEHNLRPRR
jgi:hypothetical protein